MKTIRNLILLLTASLILISFIPVEECTTINPGAFWDDCKVLMEKISGTYTGDCKRNLANGMGKAVGEDTYEGEFKKGLPDGKGKYTWSNGNYFDGEWKAGRKEGMGELVKLKDGKETKQSGYWKDDKYVGKYKEPFKKISASPEVQRWLIRKVADVPNQINVKFEGRNAQRLILKDNQKPGAQSSSGWMNISFPFEGTVQTQVNTTQGTGAGSRTVELKFAVYEEGKWEVIVYINPDI